MLRTVCAAVALIVMPTLAGAYNLTKPLTEWTDDELEARLVDLNAFASVPNTDNSRALAEIETIRDEYATREAVRFTRPLAEWTSEELKARLADLTALLDSPAPEVTTQISDIRDEIEKRARMAAGAALLDKPLTEWTFDEMMVRQEFLQEAASQPDADRDAIQNELTEMRDEANRRRDAAAAELADLNIRMEAEIARVNAAMAQPISLSQIMNTAQATIENDIGCDRVVTFVRAADAGITDPEIMLFMGVNYIYLAGFARAEGQDANQLRDDFTDYCRADETGTLHGFLDSYGAADHQVSPQ